MPLAGEGSNSHICYGVTESYDDSNELFDFILVVSIYYAMPGSFDK